MAIRSEALPQENGKPTMMQSTTLSLFPQVDPSTVDSMFARTQARPRAARPVVPRRLPTGTVTMLFTDIEGSTQLLQQIGSQAYARVLGVQRRILRKTIRAWKGVEVDTAGDGCFAVFKQAWQATAAAITAQQALAVYPWPGGQRPNVRMGLHTGRPVRFENGYVGLDVHLAARVCAAAAGGQILLSRTTRRRIQDGLPSGLFLFDLGARPLKGLEHPVEISRLHYSIRPIPVPCS